MKNGTCVCRCWGLNWAQIGRVIMGLFFLVLAVEKIMNPAKSAEQLAAAGIPGEMIVTWIVIIFLVVMSLKVIFNRMACWGAAGLAIFILLVTLVFHLDFSNPNNMPHLLKNIAIFGGLLVVMASCNSKLCRGKKEENNHEHKHENHSH